jgi:3-methyl-2-oxobutanoate hydroxymethyltransferase
MSLTNFPRNASSSPLDPSTTKVTIPALAEMKRQGKPVSALTAYDYATARLVDEAGIDLVLVGDSLAMVVMGHDNTLAVTVDEMLHHTRAVRRAVRRALVVADMPFGSYHGTVTDGVANAVRFVKEAGAEAVKIEGPRVALVQALTDAEIPVIGHLGLTPQSVHRMGGYRVQAKTLDAIQQIKADAKALEAAGAGVPFDLAQTIFLPLFARYMLDHSGVGDEASRKGRQGEAQYGAPEESQTGLGGFPPNPQKTRVGWGTRGFEINPRG